MPATCVSVPATRTAVPSGLVLPLCGDRAGRQYRRSSVRGAVSPAAHAPATPSPLVRLLAHTAFALN